MQLITMTMPMGDKGKNKNRNRHPSHSGASPNNNQRSSPSEQRSHSENVSPDNGNHPPQTPSSDALYPYPGPHQLLDTGSLAITDSVDSDRTLSMLQPTIHMPSAPTNVSSLLPVFSLSGAPSDEEELTLLMQHPQSHDEEMHSEVVEESDVFESDTLNVDSDRLLGTFPTADWHQRSNNESESQRGYSVPKNRHEGMSVVTPSTDDIRSQSRQLSDDTNHYKGVDENMNLTSIVPQIFDGKSQYFTDPFHLIEPGPTDDLEFSSASSNGQDVEESMKDNSYEQADVPASHNTDLTLITDTNESLSSQQQYCTARPSQDDTLNDTSVGNHVSAFQLPISSANLRNVTFSNNGAMCDPPIWTSLALREHAAHFPYLILSVPRGFINTADQTNFSNHVQIPWETSDQVIPGNEQNVSNHDVNLGRPTSVGDGAVPESYVFQNCIENNNESESAVYSNDICCNTDKESEGRLHTSSPLALGELDQFLSMLPSENDDTDFQLNQLADNEVAMIRPQDNEEEENEEELAAIDFTDTDVMEARVTSNPVANILEFGGNED